MKWVAVELKDILRKKRACDQGVVPPRLNFVDLPLSEGVLMPCVMEYVAPPPAFAQSLHACQPDIASMLLNVVCALAASDIIDTANSTTANLIRLPSSFFGPLRRSVFGFWRDYGSINSDSIRESL